MINLASKTSNVKAISKAINTYTSSEDTTSLDLTTSEKICSSEAYGYMAHAKDCRKYIYCQEGTAKIFTCQGGLLWKQSDGNCVWPSDSDCNYIFYFLKKVVYVCSWCA